MVWYKDFFGHANEVGKFFGIPYAEAAAHGEEAGHGEAAPAEGHGEAAAPAEGAATEAKAEGEHHYAFTGQPGEGALYIAPDNTVLDAAHEVPKWVKAAPFVAMLIGFLTAVQFYIRRPDWPAKLAANQRPLYLFLLNKWYFDEIYNFLFVRPTLWHRATSCGSGVTGAPSTGRSTASPWGSCRSSPASRGGRSRATSSPMPSRW